MAFQVSALDYKALLKQIADHWSLKDPSMTIEQWFELIEDDPKRRDRLKAVLLISVKCHKNHLDPLLVKRLICWRNEKGEPGMVEAELFKGAALRADR